MVEIIRPSSMPIEEAYGYAIDLERRHGRNLKTLEINFAEDPEEVDLCYTFQTQPFERIRRITGYLTGNIDNWNDAKQKEEGDRVKHGYCTL